MAWSGAFSFEKRPRPLSVYSETCGLGLCELERGTADRRSGDDGMEGHDGCIRDGHRSLSQGEILPLHHQPHPPFSTVATLSAGRTPTDELTVFIAGFERTGR